MLQLAKKQFIAIGYGKEGKTLTYGDMTALELSTCINLHRWIDTSQICVASSDTNSSVAICSGDLGGNII